MSIKSDFVASRLDELTSAILRDLVSDLRFNQSEIIRKSLRTLKQLTEFQKQHGELKIITSKGELLFFLIS